MNLRRLAGLTLLPCVAALIGACGGGERSPDVFPAAAPPPAAASGPDSFLLFPNPQVQADGSLQTDSLTYAQAYYAAIDPGQAKDTFAKWKSANQFDQPGVSQVTAVFGDFRDLGYGRRMTARQNNDGTIAFFVENYLVNVGGEGYGSSLNLDAAVVQDQRWKDNINAIEFSPGPGGTVKFAKFFSFDPVTGARRLEQDIDGRGPKALPALCISCHGGRADPLTPPDPATGQPRFPLLASSREPAQRGDTRGRLHVFEVDALTFPTVAGLTRADQEAVLKTMNRIVLCSYPYTGPVPAPASVDACRPRPVPNDPEWQGTAAELIKRSYGGAELPLPAYKEDPPTPADWLAQESLYRNVVVPACRSCHLVRGILDQSDIDLASFAKFDGYADRTKAHVFDRGNMPLAKIVFDRFWASDLPGQLAAYLDAKGDPALAPARDAAGRVLQPGRPIADPGPDRAVRPGATTLSAAGSLFANRYRWTQVSGPSALLSQADTVRPTFTATADGTYVIELVAGNGSAESPPVRLRLFVKAALAADPTATRFAQVRTVLGSCVGCHFSGGAPPTAFTTFDRNGDGVTDAADDAWFYNEVRGLVNFTDLVASPLLRKPAGRHHSAGQQAGFDIDTAGTDPGDAPRASYDLLLGWILNGAPR